MFFVLETAFGTGIFYHKTLGTTKNLNEATLFKAEAVDGQMKVRVSGDPGYVAMPEGWVPRSVSLHLV